MALCTSISGTSLVVQGAQDATTCGGPVLLSSSEYANFQAQMTAFGFDQTLFLQSFAGGLLMFGIGFGVGLVISLVRKARM